MQPVSFLLLAMAAHAAFPDSLSNPDKVLLDSGDRWRHECDSCGITDGQNRYMENLIATVLEPLAEATCAERDAQVPVLKKKKGYEAAINSLEERYEIAQKTAQSAKESLSHMVKERERDELLGLQAARCKAPKKSHNPRYQGRGYKHSRRKNFNN